MRFFLSKNKDMDKTYTASCNDSNLPQESFEVVTIDEMKRLVELAFNRGYDKRIEDEQLAR